MIGRRTTVTRALLAIALAAATGPALGSGFAIIEQSPSGIGSAFAGATAGDEDASAIFWNPAGLSGVAQAESVFGFNAIVPEFRFSDTGSTPVGGGNGNDAGTLALVPNAYGALRLADRIVLGVGITAPYGLQTEYEPTWIGRYAAIKTELKTIDVNPSLCLQLSEAVSIGAGFSAQYAEAELTSATPFPGLGDVRVAVTGDDWSYGFNLGALCRFPGGTRVGLSYRQGIEHTLEGDIAIGPLPLTPGTAALSLPDTAAVGIYQPLGRRVALKADAAWTGWSAFDALTILRADGSVLSSKDESWEDTWRVAVGLDVHCSDALVLRTGVAHDTSPVPDALHRTARIPDADRTWLAVGAGLTLSESLSLDVGYVHLWFDRADVVDVYAPGAALVGGYEGNVDILSAQLRVML